MRTSRRNPPCKRPSYWGRGGAGALFTCSEDNTVLLLLRAEWVEQGGTWGVPGGGIGEGFFRTPMQPITDLAVFREKAEDEVREECGGLPPGMTHLAEGLPFTEYEDCGFRYVTFIVDLTKAQKDAWRPFSADGENDAFIWFPLDEVKAGRPLPDEYGDLHDIHFGVNFTMENMPAKTNPRRRNPMRFDVRYTPEEATEFDLKRTRAGRSVLSAAIQRKSVERMANTPHTFVVVLVGDENQQKRVKGTPGAVTLALNIEDFDYINESPPREGEGIYTAFTYLHKLGDATQIIAFVDDDIYNRSKAANLKPLYTMMDTHIKILLDAIGDYKEEAEDAWRREGTYAEMMYLNGIGACVNSKMVREGYSADWTQAFADLFPLCEMTSPSRPLMLPIFRRDDGFPQKAYDVFNEIIVPDFNVKFRAFYNNYVPTLYGKVVSI